MSRRTMRALRGALVAAGMGVLAAACDSPTGGAPSGSYVLTSVNGVPIPAAVDTFESGFGDIREAHGRIVYRAIDFESADSLWYTYARDVIGVRTDGSIVPGSSLCVARRVPYRRTGNRVVFDVDPNAFNPGGAPLAPVFADTLVVSGGRLVQRIRRIPNLYRPFPRTIRLEYSPGPARTPRCG